MFCSLKEKNIFSSRLGLSCSACVSLSNFYWQIIPKASQVTVKHLSMTVVI